MEAATPLRHPHVRVIGDRLAIDGLVVEDGCTVRLVREREQNGEDPVKTVLDAVSIGARVLDREQAGANAEFVKTEFERAAGELNVQFTDRARQVAEYFNERVEQVFGPENGHLQKELEKLFSDGSSASVQNRVRELVQETLIRSREDLMKQFSASDGSNPLADFKAGTIRVLKAAEERQHESQQAMLRQMAELEKQLQALRLEKEKLEEVGAERERGTAKGRTFEEQVADAVDVIARRPGRRGRGGRRPAGRHRARPATSWWRSTHAAARPAAGSCSRRRTGGCRSRARSAELDKAMADRDADFAVLVVPTEEEVPVEAPGAARVQRRQARGGRTTSLSLALEVGYRLARARVLMKRSDSQVDAAAIHDLVERALAAMDDVRRVKSRLSGARTNIDQAYEVVEQMAVRVRGHLTEVDTLVRGEEEPPPDPDDQMEL